MTSASLAAGALGSKFAARLLLGNAFIGAWEAAAIWFVDPFFIGKPSAIAERLWDTFVHGDMIVHTGVTLGHSVAGLVLSLVIGVPVGILFAARRTVADVVEPYFLALYSLPRVALAPLFILWFGIDDAPKLWLIGLLVFYVIFIAVFAGIRSVDRRLINMARVVGASEGMIAREVIWNSLLPYFFASLKIALPRAVSAAIIGEFLVGKEGLGFLIEYSRQNFDTTGVFVGIVVATALVLVINAALGFVDRKFNAWRPTEREMQI